MGCKVIQRVLARPAFHTEIHHVRLNALQIHVPTRVLCKGLCDPTSASMILCHSIHVVVKRVQTGGGNDADLTHAAAEHLAPAVGARDEIRTADEHGAHGCAQAFREANRDAVPPLKHAFCGGAGGHRRVHQASTVHVQRTPHLPTNGRDGVQILEGVA